MSVERLRIQELVGTGAFPLPPSEPRPCSYLPGREAGEEAYLALRVEPEAYHGLMDLNFRRSGNILYRARCSGCDLCRQIRVPVAQFRASRSQRRCWLRNQDLRVHAAAPRLTREKAELYRRYMEVRHRGSSQGADPQTLRQFLYKSCVATVEVEYRDGAGRLVAVSLLDACRSSFSSVYHYFDPAEARRSPGVFSVMAEIELARAAEVPWYYLGYWVKGCAAMEYKARFHPHELLMDGAWQRVER